MTSMLPIASPDLDEAATAQLGKMEFPFDGKLECAAPSGLNYDMLPKRSRTHIQFRSGRAFHQASSSCDLAASQVETKEFPQKYGIERPAVFDLESQLRHAWVRVPKNMAQSIAAPKIELADG